MESISTTFISVSPLENILECLPDSLLLIVLSKVEAVRTLIRCSLVCRRFQKLVWQVPTLSFNLDDLKNEGLSKGLQVAKNDAIVTKTILAMSSCQQLRIFGSSRSPVSMASIHAVAMSLRNFLKNLTLEVSFWYGYQEILIQNVSCCKHLQKLRIRWKSASPVTESVPLNLFSPFPTFPQLRSLTLEDVALSDAYVETLVQHCPSLQVLVLEGISGLNAPVFKGRQLSRICVGQVFGASDFQRHHVTPSLTIEAPVVEVQVRNTQHLAVSSDSLRSLEVKGMFAVTFQLQKPHRLQKLVVDVDRHLGRPLPWDFDAFLQFLSTCSSLSELGLTGMAPCRRSRRRDTQLTLRELVGGLPSLHSLKLGLSVMTAIGFGFQEQHEKVLADVSRRLSRASGRGRYGPSSAEGGGFEQYQTLRKLSLQIEQLSSQCVLCMGALLASFPGCRELHVDVFINAEGEGRNDPVFMSAMLALQRHHPDVRMSVDLPSAQLDFRPV